MDGEPRGDRGPGGAPGGRAKARRGWRIAVIGLAAALAAAGVVGARDEGTSTPSGATARPKEKLEVGFERFDGSRASLADYRGRPVVVNFWASWCPPCVSEMPTFEQVHQRYRDRVAFLGVNLTDDPADAARLVARTGVTYDLARDPRGDAFRAFGGLGMPTTVFVSADGEVLATRTGDLSRELEDLVRRLLLP